MVAPFVVNHKKTWNSIIPKRHQTTSCLNNVKDGGIVLIHSFSHLCLEPGKQNLFILLFLNNRLKEMILFNKERKLPKDWNQTSACWGRKKTRFSSTWNVSSTLKSNATRYLVYTDALYVNLLCKLLIF